MLAYQRVFKIVFTTALVSCGALAIALVSVPLVASHGPFTTSSAIYRIPYANGTVVTANNDHHTHPNAVNRVDLGGGDGSTVVAAASGIIRGIVDRNGDSNGLGDGLAADQVTPQDDTLEHSCSGCRGHERNSIPDSTVKGLCSAITTTTSGSSTRTASGPSTRTSQTGSVTDGAAIRQWLAGRRHDLRRSGDRHRRATSDSAGGPHLHFEVAAVPAGNRHAAVQSTLGGFVAERLERRHASSVSATVTTTATASIPTARRTQPARASTPRPLQTPAVHTWSTRARRCSSTAQASSDPHNAVLTYSWSPRQPTSMTPSIAMPTYSALRRHRRQPHAHRQRPRRRRHGGDGNHRRRRHHRDSAERRRQPSQRSATTSSKAARLPSRATFTDPGTLDTHTATHLLGRRQLPGRDGFGRRARGRRRPCLRRQRRLSPSPSR